MIRTPVPPSHFRRRRIEDNPGDICLVQEALRTGCIAHALYAARAGNAHPKCTITKPLEVMGFFSVLQGIVRFLRGIVDLLRSSWTDSYVY